MATGGRIDAVELVLERSDGRRIPVLISGAPVHDNAGALVSVVLVFQDTTRLKELDEVKNEFLSMITHDLRTPISTIKGVSSLALALVDDNSELKFHLEEMDDEVDHVTELVSNLLDMTRIEAGASRREYESVHMTDIVQDAVNRQRRSRMASGRLIEASVSAELPPVYVDPLQIGRVLDNLLSNALKYSDGKIGVSAGVDDSSGQLRTTVSDLGDGIPADLIDEIFDKFMRVRRGVRRGREGAGLGLAICKAIVEAHGGRIGVDSVEREGSTFWFTVPLDDKRVAPSP
jgi:signal transduction histidine kinase